MRTRVFNGRTYADKTEGLLKDKVKNLKFIPRMASVVFKEDRSSQTYTRLKFEAAARVGIEFDRVEVSFSDPTDQIVYQIKALSMRDDLHGIMVQKPSKSTWGQQHQGSNIYSHTLYPDWWAALTSAIDPRKDVDCLTRTNLDKVYRGEPDFIPATSRAVIHILDEAFGGKLKQNIAGKRVAIVGRSELVGRPLYHVLSSLGSKPKLLGSNDDIKTTTSTSDIVISATGVPNLINTDMVKEGSIIIDVGDPKGDVNFNAVREKASFITPVPDGVGPVTVVSLLENLITLVAN